MDFNNLPVQDKIFYRDDSVAIYCGDCREILPLLSDISAIVTDPPYELGFMGKSWDKTGIAYDLNVWQGCLNALLAGGHLLAFSGTRTYHRMVCAIEDAGFEIRDMVEWMYGSGFPKSLDIGKAIDKMVGAEREVIGTVKKLQSYGYEGNNVFGDDIDRGGVMKITKPATPEAQQWEGWGTALKPAHEPICLARKPLSEKTVANNVLKYGTGGLNIDDCRVETREDQRRPSAGGENGLLGTSTFKIRERHIEDQIKQGGRFPANLIHDGSEEVMAMFPETSKGWGQSTKGSENGIGSIFGIGGVNPNRYDMGGQSAARFFYCAKASRSERDEGLDDMPLSDNPSEYGLNAVEGNPRKPRECTGIEKVRNNHPTVKPLTLMSYLIKLITPPNGIVLDPFCGSGSTLVAARQLGYKSIGIELDKNSCEIAAKRCQTEIIRQESLL